MRRRMCVFFMLTTACCLGAVCAGAAAPNAQVEPSGRLTPATARSRIAQVNALIASANKQQMPQAAAFMRELMASGVWEVRDSTTDRMMRIWMPKLMELKEHELVADLSLQATIAVAGELPRLEYFQSPWNGDVNSFRRPPAPIAAEEQD